MACSRRSFLTKGASMAATAGALGASAAMAAEKIAEEPKAKPDGKKPRKKKRAMIGACGLSCKACPLLKAKKCKGCASGKEASPEMVAKKPCPVLKCAAMKKIDYCGTGCKMFTKCKKLIGKPYDKAFMAMIAKRLGPST